MAVLKDETFITQRNILTTDTSRMALVSGAPLLNGPQQTRNGPQHDFLPDQIMPYDTFTQGTGLKFLASLYPSPPWKTQTDPSIHRLPLALVPPRNFKKVPWSLTSAQLESDLPREDWHSQSLCFQCLWACWSDSVLAFTAVGSLLNFGRQSGHF